MTVTIAKALKIKNRLVNKIAKIRSDITAYNQIIAGNKRPVAIGALLEQQAELWRGLVSLKCAISKASEPINDSIMTIAELKSEITFLGGIPHQEGTFEGFMNQTSVIKESELSHAVITSRIAKLEKTIDDHQDRIDNHNHSATGQVEVSDAVLAALM